MRKLAVLTFVTLDGVMQAPGGPKEDTGGGFKYGGWQARYLDPVVGKVIIERMGKPFDLLLGRKTYEIFAGYWPKHNDNPVGESFNKARKYVVSNTLDELEWNNSVLISGDVMREIKKLKKMKGPELQVYGSSNLIQTLMKNDLVDEFRLQIYPLTLGSGKRLFGEGTTPAAFKLKDSQITRTGTIIATYVRDGKVKTGTIEVDNRGRIKK